MAWTDEAREAVDAIEEKYDIEVVSIEHHEWIVNESIDLQAQNAFLRAVLKQVRSFLDKSPYVLASGAVVKMVRKIDTALKGSE